MSNTNRYPRTRHTQLTPEAFRELVEAATEELYDNVDPIELHDLTAWVKLLKGTILRVSEHTSGDESTPIWRGDPSDLTEGGE
jgi:hypothetical protein